MGYWKQVQEVKTESGDRYRVRERSDGSCQVQEFDPGGWLQHHNIADTDTKSDAMDLIRSNSGSISDIKTK